jgi:hypothetical protein
MLVLEKRSKDQTLLRCLLELKENKINLRTYDGLKQHIDERLFDKLIKDVFE